MAFTSQVVIIALIVLNVILIILYLRRGFRSSDEEAIDETLEVIRRRRNATEPLGSGNQERVLSDQEKEARREYVLMRVDVKNIVSNESKEITSEQQITLKDVQTLHNTQNDDDEIESSIGPFNVITLIQYVIGRHDSVNKRDLERNTKDSTRVRSEGKEVCPICLDCYQIGDDVCFSRNKECPHGFHLDCMMDWLTMVADGEGHKCREDCPLCRVDYLKVSEDGSGLV